MASKAFCDGITTMNQIKLDVKMSQFERLSNKDGIVMSLFGSQTSGNKLFERYLRNVCRFPDQAPALAQEPASFQ